MLDESKNALQPAVREAVTYDYKTVLSNRKTAAEVVDCYENLGWELINSGYHLSPATVVLEFKRSRKIKNKEQLSRIQVRLDDALDSLTVMEKNKTKKAGFVAIFIGIIGALLLGGGMSMILTISDLKVWMWITGISLGVVGFGICGLAYLVYTKIRIKKTVEMNLLIEKKRDDICDLCSDAQGFLNKN